MVSVFPATCWPYRRAPIRARHTAVGFAVLFTEALILIVGILALLTTTTVLTLFTFFDDAISLLLDLFRQFICLLVVPCSDYMRGAKHGIVFTTFQYLISNVGWGDLD